MDFSTDSNLSPLHQAARLGDIAAMDRLLAQGADINARMDVSEDYKGWRQLTPLMVAACSTDGATVETVRWLVERGADLNAQSSMGGTAAWYASGNWCWGEHWSQVCIDQVERLRYLLDAGLDPQERQVFRFGNERSLLSHACEAGDPDRVRLLLERGAIAVPATEGGDSPGSDDIPLFHAAMSGNDECLQLILEAGGDVNLYYYSGRAMLRFAAQVGNAQFVRLVLETAVELGRSGSSRPSPLVEAASAKVCSDVLQALLDDLQEADDPQPYVEVAEILLEYGADIESYAKYGWSCIYTAVFNQADRVLEWLLQQGVDPQSDDGQGRTALHAVAWHCSPVLSREEPIDATPTFRIIHHLLKAGLDVNTRDHYGNTPLHVAVNPCSMGDCSSDDPNPLAAYILLQQGADPNVCNARGKTPLMMVVGGAWMGGNCLDCVRILLEAGADPQQRYAPNEAVAAFNAKTFQEPWKVAAEIPGRTAIDDALAIYDYWLSRSANGERDRAIVAAAAECLQLLQQATKP